jgi:hypothetical protein
VSPLDLRFMARPDGRVLVQVRCAGDEEEVTSTYLVSPERAHSWAVQAQKAAYTAKRHRDAADGSTEWIITPLSVPSIGLVKVQHLAVSRVFGPTTVRRARTCESCRQRIDAGSVAYAEREPQSYSTPNWRNVRLCVRCVRPELLGRTLLDGLSKLAGVAKERSR